MSKMTKAEIKTNLDAFDEWRPSADKRISGIQCETARKVLSDHLDDIRTRIVDGDHFWAVQGHVKSVARWIEGFESGFYSHCTESGSFVLAKDNRESPIIFVHVG